MTDATSRRVVRKRPKKAAESAEVARTRGGWVPAGTAAARRDNHAEHGTERGRLARQELVDASRRVFERDGYLNARVDDIVAEAGVARGSFYTYFSSKRDVFNEICADVSRDIAAAVKGVRSQTVDITDAIAESNRRYLDVYRENAPVMALIEQVSTVDEEVHEQRLISRRRHVDRIERSIRRWQASGDVAESIDAGTTAGALTSMLSNFAYWSYAGGDSYDPDQALQTLTQIWCRALGLPENRG